jgi:cytochrome P450
MVTFDPFTEEAIEDPYPQYAAFRRHDPVHWSDKLHAWVLFRHDDVSAFFRDDERLSSDHAKAARFKGRRAPDEEPGRLRTVASDPPEHGPVRAILAASLNSRVRTIGPRVARLVATLLERVAGAVERVVERADLAGDVDLIAEFANPLPIEVIAELLDVPLRDRAQLETLSHAVARGMDRFYAGDASQGLRDIGAYFHELVQERRGAAGDDLVCRLLGAEHDGDHLSDLEVVALCAALVFAGHETTVNLIGNGMLALLARPEAVAVLRADPGRIGTAIEELLRFDSPAQLIARVASVDFDLRGRTIRAGDSVLAAIGAANRDPTVFAEPDRLDPVRTPNPHLAFGLGTHVCPGAQLSRLEARAAIPALLQRFPGLRLGAVAPVRRRTAVLRGLERLPVRVD